MMGRQEGPPRQPHASTPPATAAVPHPVACPTAAAAAPTPRPAPVIVAAACTIAHSRSRRRSLHHGPHHGLPYHLPHASAYRPYHASSNVHRLSPSHTAGPMTWIVFKLQEIRLCKGQAQKFQGSWRAGNLSAWWWVSEVLVGQVQFIQQVIAVDIIGPAFDVFDDINHTNSSSSERCQAQNQESRNSSS